MTKAKIAEWFQDIDSSPDLVKADIQSNLEQTVNLVSINALSEVDQATVKTQLLSIVDNLAENEKQRYLAATALNQIIIAFADSDDLSTIIGEAFTKISAWQSSEDENIRKIAANTLGQVANTLSGLGNIATYAIQIFSVFQSAAQDEDETVKQEASDSLGPMMEALVGLFTGSEGASSYINALYVTINGLVSSDAAVVREVAAQATQRVMAALAEQNNLGTYTTQTLAIVNNLASDSDPKVRAVAMEILASLTIAISSMEAYDHLVSNAFILLNNLAEDDHFGVRQIAVKYLQGVVNAVDADIVVSDFISIANFETITNLNLHSHSNSSIKAAAISAIPDKLSDFDDKVDEDVSVITDNLASITSLLSIIDAALEVGADASTISAGNSSQTSLDNIESNINKTIMSWINENFDNITQNYSSGESFFNSILHAISESEISIWEYKKFIINCIDYNGLATSANENYLTFADDETTIELSWLGNAIETLELEASGGIGDY